MTPEANKIAQYSEKSSDHQLVRGYLRGEIPLDEYAKLFEQSHKGIDLIQMLSKRDQNEIYMEYPSLRPKDENNPEIFKSRRSSLESIVDNFRDKKNQVIEKVVNFVKGLGIFEK